MVNNSGRLWADIEREIVRKLKTSAFEKTPYKFLPEGELDRILDDFSRREKYGCGGDLRNVITALLRSRTSSDTDKTQALVRYILDKRSPALKLFFTVLRSKHQKPYEVMVLFMRKLINDAHLPIQWSTEDDFREHLALSDSEVDELWMISHIDDFQATQRIFLAAVLTTDPEKMPGQFGLRTLPFVEGNAIRKRGGFGVVSRYTVQPENLDAIEKVRPSCVVAVKELIRDGDDVARHWISEVNALSRMNTLSKEHIVRFITAFTRGNPEDGPENLDHYIVLEWAHGGNLKDLWARFPVPNRDPAVTRWIMKQFYGLSQALSAAHYLLNEEGQYVGESYSHRDIKPENILWFPSNDGISGNLKFCDWGEAKNHDKITNLRHGTTALFGTRRYEPPEIERGTRSRLYDVWSMGCVMLECIIWLVFGLDEHKRFGRDNLGDHGISDNFYETQMDGKTVRTAVHGAVNRWIKHMVNDACCLPGVTAIGDALEIVSKGMLVVQLPEDDLDAERVTLFHRTHPMFSEPISPSQALIIPPPPRTNLMEDNPPAVGVKLAKDSRSKDVHPCEPQRYRAIELADRLGRLVTDRHEDDYWSAPGSPTRVPAPKAPLTSLLSPELISKPQASKEGLMSMKRMSTDSITRSRAVTEKRPITRRNLLESVSEPQALTESRLIAKPKSPLEPSIIQSLTGRRPVPGERSPDSTSKPETLTEVAEQRLPDTLNRALNLTEKRLLRLLSPLHRPGCVTEKRSNKTQGVPDSISRPRAVTECRVVKEQSERSSFPHGELGQQRQIYKANNGTYAKISLKKRSGQTSGTMKNLQDLAGQRQPKPVTINWTCRCGTVITDTYTEFVEGAVQAHFDGMKSRDRSKAQSQPASSSGRHERWYKSTQSTLRAMWGGEGSKLPVEQSQPTGPDTADDALMGLSPYPPTIRQPKHLKLCISRYRLYERISHSSHDLCFGSNKELWDAIRAEYKKSVSYWVQLFSLRRTRIRFVKFRLGRTGFVEIDVHSEMQERIRESLPHKDDADYDFDPREPPFHPIIGHNVMLHHFLDPCKGQDDVSHLRCLPGHKLHEIPFISEEEKAVWGLQIAESEQRDWLFLSYPALFVFLISVIFGIVWSVQKHDVQTGFTVAAYIVSGGMTLLGSIQVFLENA